MTSLPTFLQGDTATGLANGALLGSLVLALVIGTVLGFALLRSTGNTRKASDRAHDAHMEVLRLRRILATTPPRGPMQRPGPPAEPTHAFAAPDTTQQMTQVDRFGSAT